MPKLLKEPVQAEFFTPIAVPNGERTQTLALQRVRLEIPEGKIIGKVWGGVFRQTDIPWNSGARNVASPRLSGIFYDELSKMNYSVVGGQHDLFENNAAHALFSVGALIRDIRIDLHFAAKMFNAYGGNATTVMTVEWQIFNNDTKEVVYKKTVTGFGQIPLSGSSDYQAQHDHSGDESVYLAFADTVRGLMADKAFYDLVSNHDAQ